MKVIVVIMILLFNYFSFAYELGLRNLTGYDGDKKIDAVLWYPTEEQPTSAQYGIHNFFAAYGAKPIENVKGLVIFAHGFGSNMYGNFDTALIIAKSGYAVLTVNYPDLDGLKDPDASMYPIFMRPRYTYEAFVALRLSGFLNEDVYKRIFLSGFSVGGYTAMVNYGLNPQFSILPDYCDEHQDNVLLCSPIYRDKILANLPFKNDYKIDNVKGLILMAPAMGALFDKKITEETNIPVRVFAAGSDSVITGVYSAGYVASIFRKHDLTVIKDADHLTFLAPCSPETQEQNPDICEEEAGVNRAKIHNRMNMSIIDFLNSVK